MTKEWGRRLAHPAPRDRRRAALAEACAACLATDWRAARRVALVEMLADGRPHVAREILQSVRARLGRGCWGRSPEQSLWADVRRLRRGGLRIGYSRRPGAQGYYLYEPFLFGPERAWPDRPSPEQIAAWRKWTSERRLQSAFSGWELALDLARAGVRSRRPGLPAAQVEAEARRLAGGVQQLEEQ